MSRRSDMFERNVINLFLPFLCGLELQENLDLNLQKCYFVRSYFGIKIVNRDPAVSSPSSADDAMNASPLRVGCTRTKVRSYNNGWMINDDS